MKRTMSELEICLTLVLLLAGVVVGGEGGGGDLSEVKKVDGGAAGSFTSSPDIINFSRCICDGNCENLRGEDCPAGLTLDFCGCCLQCARGEGEPCGEFAGNCAHGLHCAYLEERRKDGEGGGGGSQREGTCSNGSEREGCESGSERFGCIFHVGKCECGTHIICPGTDQMFLFESENVCKSRISILLAKNVDDRESSREATDKCSGIKCPAVEKCPGDSYRLPASRDEDVSAQDCCPTSAKCVCDPEKLCPKPDCPEGWAEKIVLNATGEPGKCCPIVECSLKHFEEEKVCLYSGKKYERGESWRHLEECAECWCSVDGVVTCQRVKCNLPAECRHARALPDSCCPLCVGCVTSGGKVYNNSETWMEDDCTLCECDEGRVKCHASMCQTQCENPVHVPGECCPRCEDTDTHQAEGEKRAECGKVDCEGRVCEFGFLVDPRGCPSCRCNKCRSLTNDCPLDCPWGYELNEIGCATCSCRGASSSLIQGGKSSQSVESWESIGNGRAGRKRNSKRKQLDVGGEEEDADSRARGHPKGNLGRNRSKVGEIGKPVPMPMVRGMGSENSWSSGDGVKTGGRKTSGPGRHVSDKRCISLDERHGEIEREDGEEWSDGCRHCICKLGVEMCSLITCSPPNCEHPVFYPGDCCPRCPDEEVFKTGAGGEHVVNITVCPSGQGERPHIEADEWDLSSCLHCTCHNGLTLCSHRECGPTPCPSDRLVFDQNSCCAACVEGGGGGKGLGELGRSGPDTDKDDEFWRRAGDGIRSRSDGMTDESGARSTGKMRQEQGGLKRNDTGGEDGKRNCYSDDSEKEYFHGKSWKVGPCQSCVCENGKIECFSSSGKCPRLECERPVLAKNQCCPICLREEKGKGSQGSSDSQGSDSSSEERGRKVDLIFSRGGLEPYCAAVIGSLLCISSLLGLYILRCFYRRRRRRRLNDKSLVNPPPDYCFFNNNKNYERTRIGSSSTENSLTEKNLLFSAN